MDFWNATDWLLQSPLPNRESSSSLCTKRPLCMYQMHNVEHIWGLKITWKFELESLIIDPSRITQAPFSGPLAFCKCHLETTPLSQLQSYPWRQREPFSAVDYLLFCSFSCYIQSFSWLIHGWTWYNQSSSHLFNVLRFGQCSKSCKALVGQSATFEVRGLVISD